MPSAPRAKPRTRRRRKSSASTRMPLTRCRTAEVAMSPEDRYSAPVAGSAPSQARTTEMDWRTLVLPTTSGSSGQMAVAYRSLITPPRRVASRRRPGCRTAGNPFFVRALVWLWEDGGAAALAAVPPGVRDLLRFRLAQLPQATQLLLRQAAVLRKRPDVDPLTAIAGDEDAVLDAVEARCSPAFSRRTAPVLLLCPGARDALRRRAGPATGALARRRRRWLAAHRPGDVETLPHHLVAAGGRADPAEVALVARAAAERAEQRTAFSAAARLWQATLHALDRASEDDAGTRLPCSQAWHGRSPSADASTRPASTRPRRSTGRDGRRPGAHRAGARRLRHPGGVDHQ